MTKRTTINKTVLITGDISEPIDEGTKKYSFQLAKFFSKENSLIFSPSSNKKLPNITILPKNKLLFSRSFYKKIRLYQPQTIVYVPASSSTLMSFIRLKLITLFYSKSKSIMISVQERRHNAFSKLLIKYLKPDEIIVLSAKEESYYKQLNLKCSISPIGVDTDKFINVSAKTKIALRKKLKLPIDTKIVLHVGHINKGRNIQSIEQLQSLNYLIVIVGSTMFNSDMKLKNELEGKGFVFVTKYLKNIEDYYKAADLYIFPVEETTSAIEFPLSVFEAMSCNIPVITTEFGGIKNFINESSCIKYYKSLNELIKKVQILSQNTNCDNRQTILDNFRWDTVFFNIFKS